MVYNIKIKKFIIYIIYYADMQTFYKKVLFYAGYKCLHLSAYTIFICPHLFYDADMRT